jgi:hypothetical protein
MTTIHATFFGDQAVLTRAEFDRLVALARKTEEINLASNDEDLSPLAMTLVVERGGAFDWLADEPDLYSVDDLKVRYR